MQPGDARAPAALAALAAAWLIACEPAPPPSAPPQLRFATTEYDFGRVPQGAPIEHVFPFDNPGGATLSISHLRTACDCEATLVGGSDVAPGASAAVRARCGTDTTPGAQRRTVTVYSNDPAQRAVLLTLTGTVALEAAAEPARVYLGPVPPGASRLREVALRAGSDALRFVAASSGAPQLAVHVADGPAGRVLFIGTAADAPPGPFTAVVRVHTTSPTRPAIDVPVAGIVTETSDKE